jgi:hydrogenase-4 membrane subunit HyfE
MSSVELLSGSLVLAGLYITYQTYLIARYRRVLGMAQAAMQGLLLDMVVREAVDEDSDSPSPDA